MAPKAVDARKRILGRRTPILRGERPLPGTIFQARERVFNGRRYSRYQIALANRPPSHVRPHRPLHGSNGVDLRPLNALSGRATAVATFDLFLGSSRSQAISSGAVLRLSEDAHQHVFAHRSTSLHEYPLFSKMRDFYRGTDLPREDLDDLAGELRHMATRRGDDVWLMVVTSVLLLVEKAIREDVAIYCRGP